MLDQQGPALAAESLKGRSEDSGWWCEPVWPSGKVPLVSRGTSVRIRFGSPFSSKVVVSGHCLVTLSLMALIAAHLNAGVILVVTV